MNNTAEPTTPFQSWWARLLSLLLPWLFLALTRALIPTLLACIGPLLFLGVQQGQDLLHGLGNPSLAVFSPDRDGTAPAIVHSVAIFLYLGAAIAQALSLWYSARLLATVEPQALPPALEQDVYTQPAEWYPRCLGVFSLSAAGAAVIAANNDLKHAAVLSMLGAIGGLTLSKALLSELSAGRKRVAVALGALLLLSAVAMLMRPGHSSLGLWVVVLEIAPALLLALLVKRRDWFGLDRQGARKSLPFTAAVRQLLRVLLCSVFALILPSLLHVSTVRMCGSQVIAYLFLTAFSLLLTTAHLYLRQLSRGVPGLSAFVVLIGLSLVMLFGNEDLGQEHVQAPSGGVTERLTAPAEPGYKVYVNAFGGGLRAATFTAHVLATADDLSCGKFGQRLGALSGVSGGSIGIGVYLSARQVGVAHNIWQGCIPGPNPTGGKVALPLTKLVLSALVQDHLAPVIASMLTIDAPHVPHFAPARGQALLASLNHALDRALTSQWNVEAPMGLALPLKDLTGGVNPPILAYFNAADVDTGQITWFSNALGGTVGIYGQTTAASAELEIGQAMFHSARFPLVSPAGAFRGTRLVDGGYIDNSGADTLGNVALRNMPAPPGSHWLIIDGNQEDSGSKREHPPILTALEAALTARTGNASRAVEALRTSGSLLPLSLKLELGQDATKPALGWYLSYDAASELSYSAKDNACCVCTKLKLECAPCIGCSTSE